MTDNKRICRLYLGWKKAKLKLSCFRLLFLLHESEKEKEKVGTVC